MEIGLKTEKVTCSLGLSLVASQHIVLSIYTGCYYFSNKKVTEQGCWVNWGRFDTPYLVGTLNFYQSLNRCSIP